MLRMGFVLAALLSAAGGARAQDRSAVVGISFVSTVSVSAATGSLSEADRLYFHRHQDSNLEAAISLLEAQLQAAPGDPALLWRLGRSLVRQGEREAARKEKLALYGRAEELLRQAVALEPREAQAHYWLGLAMGRRGQTQGMLRSLFLIGPLRQEMRTVLALDPKHGGAHHVLGSMLFEIPGFAGGDKKGAVRELETAAQLEPDYSPHFTALAEAYLAVGERRKAKAALEHIAGIKHPADPGEYDANVREAADMLSRLGD